MSRDQYVAPKIDSRVRIAEPPAASIDWEHLIHGAIALLITLFIAPVLITVGFMVRLHDGGPILFRHRRIGRDGRPFDCLKFRSMAVDAEARLVNLLATDPDARAEWEANHKLRHDPRITALGAFLRKTSLDELPQLINVVRGEMSLVGPRPIILSEVPKYGKYFAAYCAVRPGITGLWQVSGRSDTSYRRRVATDLLYMRRKCAATDVAILMRTVVVVIRGDGSY